MTSSRRLVAPLIACAIAIGAATVGGACLLPTSSDPPKLQTGVYVLTSAGGHVLPVVFVDSAGRSLRVIADTFNLTANQFYDERAAVAITPRGGTEAPVAPFVVTHQSYTIPSAGTVTFIATLYGGSIRASVLSPTSFFLQMPDHSSWTYEKR
jgi:hypothetical protein